MDSLHYFLLTERARIEAYGVSIFPNLLPQLNRVVADDSTIVVIGAAEDANASPIGLIFAEVRSIEGKKRPASGWIHSLFVDPGYRRRGIGRNLLQRMETALKERGCPVVYLSYRSNFMTRPLAQLLRSENWVIENASIACHADKSKVLNAAPPHFTDRIDRLTRYLPQDYEIFPWIELTPDERKAIVAKVKADSLYGRNNPFTEESTIEPISSLGLRKANEVIGWIINHQIAPDAIRYTKFFVDPKLQPLSRGLLLLSESIRLFPEGNRAMFSIEYRNMAMTKFMQRHLQPYLIQVQRSCISSKRLSNRIAFYDLKKFPRLQEIASSWKIIRDEFKALHAPLMNIDRYEKDHGTVYSEIMQSIQEGQEYGWLKGWGEEGENTDWIQYGLIILDQFVSYAMESMPKTAELFQNLKGIKVCALVTLKANSLIPVHQHPELLSEGLLQLHLTLDAPEEPNFSYLNVDREFFSHTNGSAAIFDGSLNHFAVNASAQDRTILYMEFEKDEFASSDVEV
ncbi:MAG: GNAT family N-acetyltransferase [Geitlerinemataceae cyanobacterium]